jgi:hypothetical protein
MNPAVFQLRIMQITFIVSVVLFYYVMSMIPPTAHAVNTSMQSAIVLCAIAFVLVGFIGQRVFQRAPSQSLSEKQNPSLLTRWFAGHLMRFATAESVALFGVVLHMLGSSSSLVTTMFASSIVLLMIWQPGTSPPK